MLDVKGLYLIVAQPVPSLDFFIDSLLAGVQLNELLILQPARS